MIKKKISNARGVLLLIFVLCCLVGLEFSALNISMWNYDNKTLDNELVVIQEEIEVREVEDSSNTEVVEQKEKPNKFNPYWDYIKMNLINVDFKELKKKNKDTVGWIKVEGTDINYPYVQTTNNDFYLDHSFTKAYNKSGWAFLDYRNDKDEYGRNNIIYGHNLKSGAIFGTLNNILNKSWQKNKNNHIVKISTEKENTLWQVFSIYHIPNTIDYIQVDFDDDNEYNSFLQMLLKRSMHNFKTTVNSNDKIITLSSCYNNSNNKLVLHAKLIKREKK